MSNSSQGYYLSNAISKSEVAIYPFLFSTKETALGFADHILRIDPKAKLTLIPKEDLLIDPWKDNNQSPRSI